MKPTAKSSDAQILMLNLWCFLNSYTGPQVNCCATPSLQAAQTVPAWRNSVSTLLHGKVTCSPWCPAESVMIRSTGVSYCWRCVAIASLRCDVLICFTGQKVGLKQKRIAAALLCKKGGWPLGVAATRQVKTIVSHKQDSKPICRVWSFFELQ